MRSTGVRSSRVLQTISCDKIIECCRHIPPAASAPSLDLRYHCQSLTTGQGCNIKPQRGHWQPARCIHTYLCSASLLPCAPPHNSKRTHALPISFTSQHSSSRRVCRSTLDSASHYDNANRLRLGGQAHAFTALHACTRSILPRHVSGAGADFCKPGLHSPTVWLLKPGGSISRCRLIPQQPSLQRPINHLAANFTSAATPDLQHPRQPGHL